MSDRKALDRIAGGMGKKPALIIVDVVVGFTDPECPLGSEADAVVAANVELMNAFHQADLPVVLTTVIITTKSRRPSSERGCRHSIS